MAGIHLIINSVANGVGQPAFSGSQAGWSSVVVIDNFLSGQVLDYVYEDFGNNIAGDLLNSVQIVSNITKAFIRNEFSERRLNSQLTSAQKIGIPNNQDGTNSDLLMLHRAVVEGRSSKCRHASF